MLSAALTWSLTAALVEDNVLGQFSILGSLWGSLKQKGAVL